MTAMNLRTPVVLFCGVSAALAALAAETSAQPGSAPGQSLSDAIAEALHTPFHDGHALAGLGDQRFQLPAVGPRAGLPGHAGLAPSSVPGVPAPVVDDTPSRAKMFLLTTLAAAAGHFGTYYGIPLCRTASLRPGEGCLLDDDTIPLLIGGLATVAMTGGAAALAGGSFWRSQAGSALGWVGGGLSAAGIQVMGELIQGTGFEMSYAAILGVFSLGHAAITTLIAD